MALSPLESLLKIQQERMDVGKAMAPAQYDLAKQMSKKGKESAKGAFLGKIAPKAIDYLIGGGLSLINPALGASYAAAKPFRGLVTGVAQKYGMEKGAEYYGGKVDVDNFDELMKKYLGETVSGEKALRFDRGATESVEAQKDLQLGMLKDSISSQATMAGLTTAGKGLMSVFDNIGKTPTGEAGITSSEIPTAGTEVMDSYMPGEVSNRIAPAPGIGGAGKAFLSAEGDGNIIPAPPTDLMNKDDLMNRMVNQQGIEASIPSPTNNLFALLNASPSGSRDSVNPYEGLMKQNLMGETEFGIDNYNLPTVQDQYIGGGLIGTGMPSFPPNDPRSSGGRNTPLGYSKLMQDLQQLFRR